jgi:flagellar assembly factor FliW
MTSSQVDDYMFEIDEEHTTEITVDEPQEQVVADNVPTQEPIENLEDDE